MARTLVARSFLLVCAVLAALFGTARAGTARAGTARADPDHRRLPDAAQVHLGISLKVRDPDGLRQLLAAQQDPSSPSYHAWLDPTGFAERFGSSEPVYGQVTGWFEAHGFTVVRAPNRLFFEAVGRVDTLRDALGVQQHWAKRRGARFKTDFKTYDGPLQLPAAFADSVLHISGLDTRIHYRRSSRGRPLPRLSVPFDGSPTLVLGPDDLRLQYGLTSLLAAATPGDCTSSGASALAGCFTTAVLDAQEGTTTGDAQSCADSSASAPFIPPSSDAIAAYFALAHATAQYNPIVLPNAGDDFDICGSNQESQLDVEMQSVGAPNAASIDLVLSPASQVFTIGAQYIVNQIPKAVAVSLSIGMCEPEEAEFNGGGPTSSGSLMQSLQQTVQQGLAEGQMWFAASGDTGADDCYDQTSGTGTGFNGSSATVDFPGSLPEIVDLGGTQFDGPGSWSDAGGLTALQSEVAWNEQETVPNLPAGGAGGGGQSRYYAKPAYQSGVGPNALDGRRDVPDLALTGASATPGVAVYDCGAGQDQTCAENSPGPQSTGGIDIFGGTSVSSPLAAGLFAQLATTVGCRQGDIHAALYKLGAAQQSGGAAVFHDILSGNNSFIDPQGQTILGFAAAAGYDLATGWGTVDGAALTAHWPTCGAQKSGGGCGTVAGETTLSWLPLAVIGTALRRRRKS